MKLDILYEDADLLVVNKPAGLLSVPGRGEDKTDNFSIEVPNAPQVFIDQPAFEVNVGIHPDFEAMSIENHFVARLRITLTAKAEDKTVYVVETRQCGVFEVIGFEPPQVHHLLHVYCTGSSRSAMSATSC